MTYDCHLFPTGKMEMDFPYLFGQAQAQAQRNSDPTTP